MDQPIHVAGCKCAAMKQYLFIHVNQHCLAALVAEYLFDQHSVVTRFGNSLFLPVWDNMPKATYKL